MRQHVDPPGAGFSLAFEDLTDIPGPNRDAGVSSRQLDEARRPFDREAGPLGRGRLLALGPERHVLLLTFHHGIYDGVSMNVMMDELGHLYEAFAADAPNLLPPLVAQYADHVRTQRQAVRGGGLGDQEVYWRRAPHDAPPVLELPLDRPRPTEQQYDGGRAEFALDADVTADLRGLARQRGATPFVALLAGVDAGKGHHHCAVIDESGKHLLSRRVANDEEELLRLLADTLALGRALHPGHGGQPSLGVLPR